MAQLNFDATQVAPAVGLDPVPAGWYNCIMEKSEMKPTKDGAGAYLECQYNIVDGQYAGRKLFDRLNLRNSNPQAQEIAFKTLSAIAHAVGVLHVADSQQLHNIPLKVRAKVRPADGQYEASNDVTGYKNINEGNNGAAPGAPGAPGGFTPPAGGYAPPPQQQPAQQWQQPPQQPAQQWQQPATVQQPAQQPMQFQPQQQQPQQQPPVQQPWQQPTQQMQAPAQPWTQPPQQTQPPQTATPTPPQTQQHPAQGAVPPWQQPRQ